uniref:Secreted protein n=1 Tax=Cyprinus carpio TaxID=7962 RepID=A0A8C2C8F7_CYPCA
MGDHIRLFLCSGALSIGLLSTSSPPLSFTECCGCPSIVLLLTGVVGAKNTKVQPGWKSFMSKIKLQGEHHELCVSDKIVKMLYFGQGITLGFWKLFSNPRVLLVCEENVHFVTFVLLALLRYSVCFTAILSLQSSV